MEFIRIIQNGGSKMADASSSLFSNKWRHHDSLFLLKIILMLVSFLISSNTLSLSNYFSLYVYFERNLDSANKFNNMALFEFSVVVSTSGFAI